MKHQGSQCLRSSALLWLGVLATVPLMGAEPKSPSTEQVQPTPSVWSEDSPRVRVSKEVLGQLSLHGVVMTNYETARTYVVSKDFIATFLVTEAEAQRVNSALAKAIHNYRSVERLHLERTNAETNSTARSSISFKGAPPGPPTVESVTFKVRPFPKEAAAIRWELQREISSALGSQRANLFWEYSYLMLQSTMSTFTREEPAALGARSLAISTSNQSRNAPADPGAVEAPLAEPREEVFHTFFLRGAAPVPRVDMDEIRQSRGMNGAFMGGSSGGGPYNEALDAYVPDEFKPTLARWRQAIRDGAVPGALGLKSPPRQDLSPEEWKSREEAGEPVAPPAGDPVFDHATWDEQATEIEFAKLQLGKLQLLIFTPEGELTPEAGRLYGLTSAEHRFVGKLFQDMETRMQALELAHFEKTDATKLTFLLKAFPELCDEMDQEWLKRLGDRIGHGRARILDQAMRRHSPVGFRRGGDVQILMRRFDVGPPWFRRGRETKEFEITGTPRGRWDVKYSNKSEENRGGSFSGNWGQPPQHLRHLLATEVLESKMDSKGVPKESK